MTIMLTRLGEGGNKERMNERFDDDHAHQTEGREERKRNYERNDQFIMLTWLGEERKE